jgi:hypothetical protein
MFLEWCVVRTRTLRRKCSEATEILKMTCCKLYLSSIASGQKKKSVSTTQNVSYTME